MTIKILPARLANQIAAGEVVERPASVVKELIENSLDSGASRIDIDIDKGGSKLIRVRDNGKGIAKDELGLALSRHATSKIHCLDDLETIMSLGFRGEALASISSVSRLTITSRPAAQEQAWSAYSEGRNMEVKLQPAAHPIGTTVEVLDLFFNTPARRKFLRTEKTEFSHIEELVRRIALSRFDVSLNLKHNGKIVKQYRASKTDKQTEQRLASVCGSAFVRHMLKIELEHNGLKLHGWITTPQGARQQGDLQYCYVNGRMMRDKLINHAIRQSYETSLEANQFAAYVLFIEIDPKQVDVNVHPAKHEVRFHQARLVHDFIYQALSDALVQGAYIEPIPLNEGAFHQDQCPMESQSASAAYERERQVIDSVPNYPGKEVKVQETAQVREQRDWITPQSHTREKVTEQYSSQKPRSNEIKAYQQLLTVTSEAKDELEDTTELTSPNQVLSIGKAMHVIHDQYLVTADKLGTNIVNLAKAEWLRVRGQLLFEEGLKSQPLLVPLAMKLDNNLLKIADGYKQLFTRFGLEIRTRGKESIIVMGVPNLLRQQNLQQLIPDLLTFVANHEVESQSLNKKELADWLSFQITRVKDTYTLSEAIQILADIELTWKDSLPLDDRTFVKPVDFLPTITTFTL